jgi:hypothetical protein
MAQQENNRKSVSKIYFPLKQFSPRFGNDFFSFEILTHQVLLPGESCCALPHVEYTITMYSGRDTWTVSKRYSQFCTLFADLKEHHNEIEGQLPSLPGKTWFPIVYDEHLLSARRENLSGFLDGLLCKLNQFQITADPIVLQFFDFSNPADVDQST